MATLIEQAEWADGIYQIEKTDPVVGGVDGISNKQAKQLANRTAFLKQQTEDLSTNKANLASPELTGTPTAPTAAQSVNSQQIATTAFVKTAITQSGVGNKAEQDDFISLRNLLVGVPIPHPMTTVPSGCLAMNGQTFNKSTYPELAKKYPTGKLPDLRGEFIRGLDMGRNVDSGRALLSEQSDLFKSHTHSLKLGIVNTQVSGYASHINRNQLGWGINGTDGLAVKANGEATTFGTGNGLVYSSGGNETRPRNIAFQYICLAA
ncbi:hypothetical protein A4G18_07420 [Pasteurellaceae bacterium Pebbles2]|nr:hypothetical protein [Pasteurellaceae bacterium Pebbles2]